MYHWILFTRERRKKDESDDKQIVDFARIQHDHHLERTSNISHSSSISSSRLIVTFILVMSLMQPISPSKSFQTQYSRSSSSSLVLPQCSSMPSPQSVHSIDGSVFGPNMPSSKSSTTVNLDPNNVDLRRLILFNLPLDLVREYLELYLEHLSGEAEIERIDYSNLEDTTVMVTFKSELGMCAVRARLGQTIDRCSSTIYSIKTCLKYDDVMGHVQN
jgi:hypothetical protein